MTETADASAHYRTFAEQLIQEGILTDPWFEGSPRFQQDPVWIPEPQLLELYRVAEGVAAAMQEACELCSEKPELLDEFLCLTPYQKLMWASSSPAWHGFARVDLFTTKQGILACEINADTPTGQPEAVLLNQHASRAHPGARDPNLGLEDRLCSLLEMMASAGLDKDVEQSVGLIYPTELTEDLPLVRCYQNWLQARGWKVVLGSPFNLSMGGDGRIRLFGQTCSIILRHYKTDWWGERVTNWLDEERYADPEPLRDQLGMLIESAIQNRCVVINPFGAVVAQNKRTMALMWEQIHLFSEQAQQVIRDHIPQTLRLESMHREQLSAERDQWVLKSDYGCEGSEVIIGRLCTQAVWDESLQQASPGHWVVQQFFEALTNERQETANFGVYLFGGEASGIYLRVQAGPTDVFARSAPILIPAEGQ